MDRKLRDAFTEGQLNESEGESMSESEIASHFGEKVKRRKKKKKEIITKEDAEQYEKEQNESNDIYKVAARVKNYARSGGGQLTPVGEGLCNAFTHTLMTLYNFAETLSEDDKNRLLAVLKEQEKMPAQFIAAAKNK